MLRHIKTVHEVTDDIPIMSKVKCPDCDASFINRSGMNRHMRSVHGEKKYSCEQCNFVASRKDVLLRHVRHAHCVKYSCNQCDFEASKNVSLKLHIKYEHF